MLVRMLGIGSPPYATFRTAQTRTCRGDVQQCETVCAEALHEMNRLGWIGLAVVVSGNAESSAHRLVGAEACGEQEIGSAFMHPRHCLWQRVAGALDIHSIKASLRRECGSLDDCVRLR